MSLKWNWSSNTPPSKHYFFIELDISLLSHPAAVDFIPKCLNRAVLPSGPICLHKAAGLYFWRSEEKLDTLRPEFPSGPKFW